MNGIQTYYEVLFGLSLVFSFIYVYLWHRHFSVSFSLVFAFVPVVTLGYVFQSHAQSLEAMTIAIKLIYLGGCFLILFIMMNVFDMCHIPLPKILKLGFLIFNMGLYLCILTIGHGTLFYRDITAHMTEDGLRAVKVYGVMHTVYYVVMVFYFALTLGAILYSLFRKKEMSRRIIWLLFAPVAASLFSYFGGRLITDRVELIPAAYVLSQFLYLLIAHRVCLYDISETAIDSLTETGATGFLSFDSRLRYLGSNRAARDVFDEVKELTVDKPLGQSPALERLILPWLETFRADETQDKQLYRKGERVYLIDINDLYDESRRVGWQLVITDDTENQKYIDLLGSYNSDLEREVKEKTAGLVRLHGSLIRGMAMMVESRDNSTGGHIIRTSDVVELLLDEIMQDTAFTAANGIDEDFRGMLIKAAPLHDIGKIAVDDAVLRKPGRFTPEEFEKMKQHAPEGARVLHNILEGTDDAAFRRLAENVAHYHHERMDGSGYPDGLAGDAIPIEARIMAIADVYDALVSKRVYKDSMSFEKADAIMMDSMGRHFDKRLEKFYIAARPKMERYYLERND